MIKLDLINKKYGRLKVISFAGMKNGYSYWQCICLCGKTKEIRGSSLTAGEIQSCGCLRLEHFAAVVKGVKKPLNRTTVEFVEELLKVHGNKYDYSKVQYTGIINKIIIICKNHQFEFTQSANNHLSGHGCPKCAKEETAKFNSHKKKIKYTNQSIDQFIIDNSLLIQRLEDYDFIDNKILWKCL